MKIKRFLRYMWQALRVILLVLIGLVLVGNIYLAAARNIFRQTNPTFFRFLLLCCTDGEYVARH